MVVKWIVVFCVAAAVVFRMAAQETPVVRVNTRLVEVDVVVHSKGEAVADLNRDDFTVLDNGKPQKVAAFNILSSRSSRPDPLTLPVAGRSGCPPGKTVWPMRKEKWD